MVDGTYCGSHGDGEGMNRAVHAFLLFQVQVVWFQWDGRGERACTEGNWGTIGLIDSEETEDEEVAHSHGGWHWHARMHALQLASAETERFSARGRDKRGLAWRAAMAMVHGDTATEPHREGIVGLARISFLASDQRPMRCKLQRKTR
jgi:hypothetical protein